jgi:hypothetical protein
MVYDTSATRQETIPECTLTHYVYQLGSLRLISANNHEQPVSGPLVAAIITTFWGYVHIVAQLYICALPPSDGKLRWVLDIGLIIPLTALFTSTKRVGQIFIPLEAQIFGLTIPRNILSDKAILDSDLPWKYVLIYMAGCVFYALPYPMEQIRTHRAFTLKTLAQSVIETAAITGAWFCTLPCAFALLSTTAHFIVGLFLGGIENDIDCSLWKPCTEISIAEWDQAFALLCALALFGYEMGSEMLRLVHEAHTFLREKLPLTYVRAFEFLNNKWNDVVGRLNAQHTPLSPSEPGYLLA